MENDDGYYQWINQPFPHSKYNLFKPLTRAALDNIIEEVNIWYDKKLINL
jgi:hypothetical protein